jgi:tetratricopeptide (TPR) repeat protein
MEDTEIGDAYNLLGLIHKDLKHRQESVDCYEKALEAYFRSSSSNNAQVIAIHHNASLAYLEMGDNRLAEEHRQEASALLVNSSLTSNPLIIAMTENLTAKLQTAHGNLNSAFQSLKVVLERKNKELPAKHPSIASTLNEMGIVQEKMGNDEEALKNFKQALDMCSECLTTSHFDLAEYHANIGRIYYKRKQYQPALEEFELALKIITDYTRDENENIVILMKCISDINDILDPRPIT